MFFVLKKAVSRLLFPLPLTILLLAAGLLLAWRGRSPRAARALLISGLALLLLFSTSAMSDALLRPLESRYPALGPQLLEDIDWESVRTIVVFAGCAVAFDDQPITRQMSDAPLARLIEGVRLYHACPDCTLILSGGLGCDADAPVESLTNWRLATSLGVDPEDIVIERASLDTEDQARILAEILIGHAGQQPFIVVTSASHMPRTMALFEAEGVIRAIPAPTDYATGLYGLFSREGLGVESLYPNARALWNSERAVYEYLGLLWAWVRNLG